jgi:hypothetical protein
MIRSDGEKEIEERKEGKREGEKAGRKGRAGDRKRWCK